MERPRLQSAAGRLSCARQGNEDARLYVLILSMLAAGQSLDAFDNANLALTKCAYTVFSASNAANRSNAEFERLLTSECRHQIDELRRQIVAIEIDRGESRSAAESQAERLIARFHADFSDQYSRRAEDAEKLRALERALEQEGKANAP